MNHNLKHKRALVTGGSHRIGAAIVKRLAMEGAYVAFSYPVRQSALTMLPVGAIPRRKSLAIQAAVHYASAVRPLSNAL